VSCFDIHEKITVHHDKSGEIMFYIENSGIGGMLAYISGNQEYDDMTTQVDSLAQYLSVQEGISKVEYNLSPFQGDMFLKIAFENTKALNKAFYGFLGYKKLSWLKKYIKIKRKKLLRMNISPFLQMYIRQNKIQLSDYQEYIASIKVISKMQFPGEIKTVKGENYEIEDNSVTQTFSLMSLLYNTKSTALKVKYKRKND
jgi:hypothetical protein